MLIQKLNCPYGCQNSTFTESVKTTANNNTNLLLDANGVGQATVVETTIAHTCNCCGNTFETHQRNDGRMVL